MKELSIQEKAKRYDEAKRRGLDYIRLTPATELVTRQSILEHIFPELKESEGEEIRNFLIDFIKVCGWTEKKDQGWPLREECLAWLEKQGEHAKFRDSIQVGDKVTRNQDGVLVNLSQLKRVAKKDEKQGNNMGISEATKQELEDSLNRALEKETPESCNEFLEKQYSQILANSAKTCKDEQKPVSEERVLS